MDRTVIVSISAFVAMLAVVIYLRTRNSKLDVKPTDVVVAILPVVIFLLVTGKIQKFEAGGVKIETAFVKASSSAITSQVTTLTGLPSEPIRVDPKLGADEIPRLIERKTQGLLFRLGYGSYYGPVITDYLVSLTKQPFLRYLVVENPDGAFFAMADARSVADLLSSPHRPYTAEQLAGWLNSSDRESLKRLPGFISSEGAVTEKTDKRQALQLMESLNVDTLPVVGEDKRFVGVVNRSRLAASLILDVAKELKK